MSAPMSALTMVVTRRFSDGSGGTQTHVGDAQALAQAFSRVVPSPAAVRDGFDIKVQFYPAPKS